MDFAVKPTLTGQRVVLRPVCGADAAGLLDLVRDPEGRQLTGTPAPSRPIQGFRDRGLGSEAVSLTLAHAFAAGLHRVELEVYAFNPRAIAVYERAGFAREGVRRDALRWDGADHDAIPMAALEAR